MSSDRNSRLSADAPIDVDKESLYGEVIRQSRWKDDLHKKAAHKALDIPEDDDMNVDNSRTGIGAWGAIGIAAMAGLPPTILAAVLAWNALKPESKPEHKVEVEPVKSEFDVIHYDQHGNVIDVPHVSTKPE